MYIEENTYYKYFALIYFLLAIVHVMYLYLRKNKVDVKESFSSLLSGSAGVVITGFIIKFVALYFLFFLNKFSFYVIEWSIINFVLCLLVLDFLYYTAHRFGHSVKLLWGAHIVHHSGKNFNLSLGVRQGVVQHIFAVFYIPLPLIGFQPEMIVAVYIVSGAIQFFHHLDVRIPQFLNYLFITPNLHKIHHGLDHKYHNKNFGGVFSIWDRIFGTYQEPEINNEYELGVDDVNYSYNIINMNFDYFIKIYTSSKKIKGFKSKILYLLGKP